MTVKNGRDIHGDGVNVAARLEALAEPGGICVSRVVREQVCDKVEFGFEDLGEQQVNNIARPVLQIGSLPDPATPDRRSVGASEVQFHVKVISRGTE
jgi:class 3 adenylate cyclase